MRLRVQFNCIKPDATIAMSVPKNDMSTRNSKSSNLAIVDIAPAPKTITKASLSFQDLWILRSTGRGSPRIIRSLAIVNPFVAIAGF